MKPKIIAACEAFSLGQSANALLHIADEAEWHIVGDHTIVGKAGIEATCTEAEAEGNPNFKNIRTIEGRNHVVVEGNDLDSDIHYCDIYTIEEDTIYEISSYCLARQEGDFAEEGDTE